MRDNGRPGAASAAYGRGVSGSDQGPSSDEHPRHRLLHNGPESLSNAELLAVLFRTGRPGSSALDSANDVLRQIGGLIGLVNADDSLQLIRGVGQGKASTLLAAIELGRRLAKVRFDGREMLNAPESVAEYLLLRYGRLDQEVMGALFLNSRNRLIAEREIYRGTLNRTAVEPRAILKEALLRSAASMVLWHTHTSGDPAPSIEDLDFTRRIQEAGKLLSIRLVDHLILGAGGRWVSLSRRGGWHNDDEEYDTRSTTDETR
jgi:DNA repair protein RadC